MAKLCFLLLCLAVIFNAVLAQDCSSPLVTGPCRAAMKVYGFDTKTGSCRQFIYGGCGGNNNRYTTLKDCQDACENYCNAPLVTGPCKAAFVVYGFDTEIGACRQFIYGGCQGNNNRYSTLEECQDTCEDSCYD